MRTDGTIKEDNSMKKVVIYGTGHEFLERLAPFLSNEGVHWRIVGDQSELLKRLESEDIHLLLIETGGGQKEQLVVLELLAEIRKVSCVPILVVSAQESESAKIMMFHGGADDYVLVDCNPLELLARMKSQLRRYTQFTNICGNKGNIYQIGDLVVNDQLKKVVVNGEDVSLTPIEYKILRLLVQEQGKVIPISKIYEAIWHMKAVGVDNTIAVHICHIREKIEANPRDPQYLKVVWGEGYKLG